MTIERIESISETERRDGWQEYEGFEVVTSQQRIFLGISNSQSCCEDWGYFWSNDATEDFIGAELRNVKITDQCLNTEKAPKVYEGDVMFVTLETDRGDLQFVAYNEHNGYYGHSAIVRSTQLTVDEVL